MMHIFTNQFNARSVMLYAFLLVPLLTGWKTGYAQLTAGISTYTVGTNGNFPNLTGTAGVFQALNQQGSVPAGGYTFQIISDITEPSDHVLNLLANMQAGNPIRIVPNNSTPKVISGSVVRGMIRLLGAAYVTIDGDINGSKVLTFRNTATGSTSGGCTVFTFRNNAQFNTIRNCIIEGSNIHTANGNIYFLGASDNTIENCDIRNSTGGIPVNGIASGTTGTEFNSRNIIRNNNIFNFSLSGIKLDANNTEFTISNNSFYQTTSVTSTSLAGIRIDNTGTHTISGNTIKDITNSSSDASSSTTGIHIAQAVVNVSANEISNIQSQSTNTSRTSPAVSAILVTSGTANISQNTIHTILATNGSNSANNHAAGMTLAGTTTVSRNRIYNISNSSGGEGNAATGIIVHSGAHTITNNMITMGMGVLSSVNNSDLIPFYGIWNATTATSLNVYYNSVHIGGENRQGNSRSYNTFCFYRGTGVTTPVIIMNNLFQNTRLFNELTNNNDPKAKHYAIGSDETTNWSSGSVTVCNGVPSSPVNYNAYFSLASNRLGKWAGTDVSYAGWQTSSGGDAQSVNLGFTLATSITFANANTADLHVASTVTNNILSTANSALDQKGAAISSVPTDFDNDFRRAPSDIGADEFSRIIYSNSLNGSWSVPGTWTPSGVPTFWDEIVIRTGHIVTVPINEVARFYRLTIQTGGVLILTDNTSVLEGSILHNSAIGARGEFTIENNAMFFANNGIVRLAGRLTNNSISFNAGSGIFFMNFDDILVNESCASSYILSLNRATPVSDINGTFSTTFSRLTLLNNASTSIISDFDPALFAAKTITVSNIFDIQGTGVFSIGGSSTTNTSTLAIGSSTINGTITGTGTISGSVNSNLHIFGTAGNVSTNPVTFTSGARLLNNLWIERQNATDAISLGIGGVRVSGRLTLNRGHINTLLSPWSNSLPNDPNASILTLDVNALVTGGASGGSNNSYVNGPMAKITNTTDHFSFPVGNVDMLGRIGITPTSTNLTTFTARYYKEDPTLTSLGNTVQTFNPQDPVNDLHHVSEREYWMLDRTAHTGVTPADGRVRMHWTAYSLVYFWNPDEWAGLRIARHNGSVWENKGPGQNSMSFSPNANPNSSGYNGHLSTVKTYEAGYVESDLVTNFSPFTFATTLQLRLNPLPVELLTLKAVPQDKQINVDWITATEINSDYFIVERSTDAKNFSPIGKVAAAGISKTIRNYTFADKRPHPGVNYYRLQQVDKDGSARTSHIVSAEIISSSLSNKFEIYPNPSDGRYLTIQLPYQGEMIVSIYNAVGAEIEMQRIMADGRIATLQPRTSLASGIYVIKVVTAKGSYQQKIIVR